MHNYERPLSYLAFQNAEMNRDRKKQRKPFKLEDFYFYDLSEQAKAPDSRYGAAALALIKKKEYPMWALFVYKDLKEQGENVNPPSILSLQCDDAIVLAPTIDNDKKEVTGLLIAMESASNQQRTMRSPCGLIITLQVPIISNKYEAIEDVTLSILSNSR